MNANKTENIKALTLLILHFPSLILSLIKLVLYV